MKKILLIAFLNMAFIQIFGQVDLKDYSTSYAGDMGKKTHINDYYR